MARERRRLQPAQRLQCHAAYARIRVRKLRDDLVGVLSERRRLERVIKLLVQGATRKEARDLPRYIVEWGYIPEVLLRQHTHHSRRTLLCSGAEMSASASAPDPAASSDLAEGWEAVTDDQGRTYWWNVDTNETTWDKPTAVVAKKGIAAGYLAATTSRLASASASEELEILQG